MSLMPILRFFFLTTQSFIFSKITLQLSVIASFVWFIENNLQNSIWVPHSNIYLCIYSFIHLFICFDELEFPTRNQRWSWCFIIITHCLNRSSRAPIQQVFDVSAFQNTWFKWSGSVSGFSEIADELTIWIKCAGRGRHLKQAGNFPNQWNNICNKGKLVKWYQTALGHLDICE